MSILTFKDDPGEVLAKQLSDFRSSGLPTAKFIIEFNLPQYWLPSSPDQALTALYHLIATDGGVDINFTVTDSGNEWLQLWSTGDDLLSLCEQYDLPFYCSSQVMVFDAVSIAKPWGQEIWYTGIEERGVARLKGLNQFSAPIPWVLAACRDALCGQYAQSLILLKILDPLPEAVVGDLYFELHEKKREVYVVTSVDERAWPDGIGSIRFGFCEVKKSQFDSPALFKQAFARSVKRYEAVRRNIDTQQGEVASPELLKQELQLRNDMESFTQFLPLQVGDVVKVPCFTPHSLQHGVRTVEFQTPVYERLILSFAQKVLTQDHWDTDQAIDLMSLDTAPALEFEQLDAESAKIERIVDFDDFEVLRYQLAVGQKIDLPAQVEYALLMVIKGAVELGDQVIEAEEAVLLPKSWRGVGVQNRSNDEICFLIAHPK